MSDLRVSVASTSAREGLKYAEGARGSAAAGLDLLPRAEVLLGEHLVR